MFYIRGRDIHDNPFVMSFESDEPQNFNDEITVPINPKIYYSEVKNPNRVYLRKHRIIKSKYEFIRKLFEIKWF